MHVCVVSFTRLKTNLIGVSRGEGVVVMQTRIGQYKRLNPFKAITSYFATSRSMEERKEQSVKCCVHLPCMQNRDIHSSSTLISFN